jgi:hypothetical protein
MTDQVRCKAKARNASFLPALRLGGFENLTAEKFRSRVDLEW